MLKGFRDFILRGNVIDLAVGVVIGAAFTAVVNAVVANVFNPLIGAVFQAGSLDDALDWTIELPTGEAVVKFGALIGALITFVITAAVVYFVFVLPINSVRSRAEARLKKDTPPAEAEAAPAPTDIELLAEIRDLLQAQNARPQA